MSRAKRICLSSVLVGDELGQIKLVQIDRTAFNQAQFSPFKNVSDISASADRVDRLVSSERDASDQHESNNSNPLEQHESRYDTTQSPRRKQRHRVVRVLADCLQSEPAPSRAITTIRPITGIQESSVDTTDKPNSLFLVANKIGQLFVCNTNAIECEIARTSHDDDTIQSQAVQSDNTSSPIISPVYYNMNSKVPVVGAQPLNQTSVLVIYLNGDIQHVSIAQDVLQSSLKMRRKAIRVLGLGYNSDAHAAHWRIDGNTGLFYFEAEDSYSHLNESDPLTDIVLNSPMHKLSKKRTDRSQQNLYNMSPCIKSRKNNEQDRLVPAQVINMMTSRTHIYRPPNRLCRWSSITSLNLIYRKLALYDLVGSENFERHQNTSHHRTTTFKLSDGRLAVGGEKYAVRVYDVQTQKAIYNCLYGPTKHPASCSHRGDPMMVGDLDWLGGNKTTRWTPNMIATCSGVNSVVNVFDIRCARPAYYLDLTHYTENMWQPYEHHPRGCMFTSICASGAPYSTAVPAQQLSLGSTNGQLHIIDLRFVARSHRILGKLSGFCGGSVREIRFVAESLDKSKMISCATDRFVRMHTIKTSYTSVMSQRLTTKVFLGTKPTCIQPVCDEVSQDYLSHPLRVSDSRVSTLGSDSWSVL